MVYLRVPTGENRENRAGLFSPFSLFPPVRFETDTLPTLEPPRFGWTQKTALESQKGRNGAHPLSPWTPGHWINTMNAKVYSITTCDDPIQCPNPWTPVDSGYVMHEIGMGQNCRQPGNRRTQGFTRPSFPCVRAGGKDTFCKSQLLASYEVKLEKYFANRVANLAKRQSTRSRKTSSLHRCKGRAPRPFLHEALHELGPVRRPRQSSHIVQNAI